MASRFSLGSRSSQDNAASRKLEESKFKSYVEPGNLRPQISRRGGESRNPLIIFLSGFVTLIVLCTVRTYERVYLNKTEGALLAYQNVSCASRGSIERSSRSGGTGDGGGRGGGSVYQSSAPRWNVSAPSLSCRFPSFLNVSFTCKGDGLAATRKPRMKLPPWRPSPGKFLLVTCFRGRASNRHGCLKRSLILSALLNRTAIIPEEDFCPSGRMLPLKRLYDLTHMDQCLSLPGKEGDGGSEVKRMKRLAVGEKLEIDQLHCDGKGCPETWCSHLLLTFPANAGPLFSQASVTSLTMMEIISISKKTDDAKVLSLGDLFYTYVEGYEAYVGVGLGPLLSLKCERLFKPPAEIYSTAAAFTKVYTGSDYAALHMRRADMKEHCASVGCHYPPVGEVALCVADGMEAAGLHQLFLATDGTADEVDYLERMLLTRGIAVTRFVPGSDIANIDLALVDKLVCAQAKQFFFQSSSSFATQVVDLRAELGAEVCGDKDVGGFHDQGWAFNNREVDGNQET